MKHELNNFVVKQLHVGDLGLACVRVQYCNVLSSLYFTLFLAEQAKTLHALRAVIRLKIC